MLQSLWESGNRKKLRPTKLLALEIRKVFLRKALEINHLNKIGSNSSKAAMDASPLLAYFVLTFKPMTFEPSNQKPDLTA